MKRERKFEFNTWETANETVLDCVRLTFTNFAAAERFARKLAAQSEMSGYFINLDPLDDEPGGYEVGSDTYIQITFVGGRKRNFEIFEA